MVFCLIGLGTQAQKKSLTPEDFDHWQTISGGRLSPDGRYVIYELQPGMGDGSLIIHDLEKRSSDTIPRGSNARFSGDGSYIAFSIETPLEIRRKEETEKTSGKKKQKDSMGIYMLNSKQLTKYPDNHGMSMPEEGSSWMVYKTLVEVSPETDTTATANKDSLETPKAEGKVKKDTLLLALNPVKGDSLAFKDIDDYSWAKKAGVLMLNSQQKDSTGAKSYLMLFNASNAKLDTIYTADGEFKGITTDEQGEQLAFLHTADTTDIKSYALMTGTSEAITTVQPDAIKDLPNGWEISKNANPYFSEDGKKLFFGTAYPEQETEKDTLLNREREKLDIWAWTDKQLQPMQLLNKSKEEKRTYRAVYHMARKEAIQLADSSLPEVSIDDHGNARYAIARDGAPYERAQSWSGLWINDFYLVDTETGARKELVKGQSGLWKGPDEKYALLYDRKDSVYYGIELATGKRTPLTNELEVVFYNELHDTPSEPRPYGLAGWTKDDQYVLVYDRYDIWRLDPSGKKAPLNLTRNGRTTNTEYRYVQLDRDEDYIDLRKEVVLRAFNETTKEQGIAFTRFNRARDPRIEQMGDHEFNYVMKAKDADKVLFTMERFDMYPDLMVSTSNFKDAVKISNAGAQMDDFKWGETRLVTWKGYDGSELQGVLYLPQNMEAGRKYPMVTYFYERSSDRIHSFNHPAPSRSVINKSFYVSNDYIVFVPDIVYRDGYPGQSAFDCIVSGVEAMVEDHSFIDTDKIALQGQSWGGYQTAYLITQTDRFAAAMAGAPVSNMTSAYGGIRWGSGMSRMFQYERTQSRLGVTLWDNQELYLQNSPLFYADKVNTPLLMMHNDNDGAVPWYQGIEYFVALRRLDKPVWMLNYNGMPHNLSGNAWGNRKDLSIRMMQFFDHYLKGEEAPQWMEKGRPAVEKETNKAY